MQRRNEAVQVVWFAHRHILYASPLFCRLPPVCSASAVKSLPVPGPVCGCLRMLRVTLPPLTHTEIASGAPYPSQKGTAQVQISGKVPYPGSRWIREKEAVIAPWCKFDVITVSQLPSNRRRTKYGSHISGAHSMRF